MGDEIMRCQMKHCMSCVNECKAEPLGSFAGAGAGGSIINVVFRP